VEKVSVPASTIDEGDSYVDPSSEATEYYHSQQQEQGAAASNNAYKGAAAQFEQISEGDVSAPASSSSMESWVKVEVSI